MNSWIGKLENSSKCIKHLIYNFTPENTKKEKEKKANHIIQIETKTSKIRAIKTNATILWRIQWTQTSIPGKKYLRSTADVFRISKAERLEDLDPISSFSLETALEATILHFEFKDNGPWISLNFSSLRKSWAREWTQSKEEWLKLRKLRLLWTRDFESIIDFNSKNAIKINESEENPHTPESR